MLVHEEGCDPTGTGPWLAARPHLARHHHIRLSHTKVSALHLSCCCLLVSRAEKHEAGASTKQACAVRQSGWAFVRRVQWQRGSQTRQGISFSRSCCQCKPVFLSALTTGCLVWGTRTWRGCPGGWQARQWAWYCQVAVQGGSHIWGCCMPWMMLASQLMLWAAPPRYPPRRPHPRFIIRMTLLVCFNSRVFQFMLPLQLPVAVSDCFVRVTSSISRASSISAGGVMPSV